MNVAWYALWFLVAVSLLVTVHEYGHYIVARLLGFKVLRFSVGMGKPLLKYVGKRDRTEYVISAIPLGGYVKLLDEREGPVPPEELSRSFTRKPPWQRIVVLLAGPAFNIAFAILVLWGILWFRGFTEDLRPVVGEVAPGTVAAQAGLRPGDEIVAIDGEPVGGQRDVLFTLLDAMSAKGAADLTVRSDGVTRNAALAVSTLEERRRLTEPETFFTGLGFHFWRPPLSTVLGAVEPEGPAGQAGLRAGDEIVAVQGTPVRSFAEIAEAVGKISPGESVLVRYKRDGTERAVRITAGSQTVQGRTVGYIGVRPSPGKYPESMIVRTGFSTFGALGLATQEAWDMTLLQARLVWRMLLGQVSLKNLSGPISIAEFAGDFASDGVGPFLGFLVLISLSLGFLNLLPIPILDGGQIVFQLIEWVKGSPLSDRAQAFGQQVGIALLLLLMGVALFNDILRQLA